MTDAISQRARELAAELRADRMVSGVPDALERLASARDEMLAQKPVAWLDDFGNAFPLSANKGAGSWIDAHKRSWRPLYAAPVAAAPADPVDPMDWPLPCDVKVGHGAHAKGTKLRSLVRRMQVLYDMAQAAAPVPLTDEQIDEEWFYIYELPISNIEKARMLARAIERAHGIGQPQEGGAA